MQVVSREGSLVTLRDKKGKLWLTHRVRKRKDSRRRILTGGWSVRHIPIRRIVEKGDWIFTCSLLPLRFGEWQETWDGKFDDDFVTMEGSHHSKKHCSLTPISDEYAEFFIKHNLSDLFEINNKDFDLYEEAVKKVCEAFKIKFEGI